MKVRLKTTLATMSLALLALQARAQLSSNPDKFLGNISTRYQVDYGSVPYWQMWNQITAENESKWGSIEGNARGQFNWGGSDLCYNYAKQHGFPFKFHTLVWGSQYPSWINSLSTEEQYKAIEEWMDAVKQRYPDLQMIDVVNEAIAGHAPAPYKAALGNDGVTGYDWIIRAFEMAHERWPDAILIYNDYNTFRWQKTEFIELVRTLRDAGAPIDAYGCQSHDLTDMEKSDFTAAMAEIQDALRMPMYSTEYDIGTTNDAQQLKRYQEQIPCMWEADYCAGVTLWGYIYGATWTTDGNSGIIRDGADRPAMTWLRQYMASDAAKKAKSPFPGMKKEASVYVKCAKPKLSKGENVPIEINARLKTKTMDHIELYVNNQKVGNYPAAALTKASYTPANKGRYDVKAVVVATDGNQYERYSGFYAYDERLPYKAITQVPGTLQAEDFDKGGEGYTFHDSDTQDEGNTHYRTDGGGVDIVTGNGGYALGYTASGEWTEYTVNVNEAGDYNFEAYASSGTTGSGFTISLVSDGQITPLCKVSVPQTANNSWDTYKAVTGKFSHPLPKGQQTLRISIDSPYCNIDKIVMKHIAGTGISQQPAADGDQQDGTTYNLAGQQVGRGYKGIVVRNGKKMLMK